MSRRSLHFLDEVAVSDEAELVENEVDARLDEKCFVHLQRLVQQHQIARTGIQAHDTLD